MPAYTLLVDTARPFSDSNTGTVSTPRHHLDKVLMHLEPYPVLNYTVMPSADLNLLYQGSAPPGTDIVTGDVLERMVLVADGVTPYPSDSAPQDSPNQQWVVSLAHDSQPGPGAHRVVYVTRMFGGGAQRTARG